MEEREDSKDRKPTPSHHNDRKDSSTKNVEDNPKQLASLGIANAYVNAHNIDKLAQTLEQCKDKMVEMKEVLRKEERVCRE